MHLFKSFFIATALFTLMSCGNSASQGEQTTDSTASEASAGGKIEFEETTYDFGEAQEGDVVEHVFTYTNIGTAPVILSQVSASCGCTTPSYTQTPVLPGKTGEVKVSFDSNGQTGKQQKIVTIVSNAENRVTTVQLKGEVSPK